MGQDDRDRLGMLLGQQTGGLRRIHVEQEVEGDDLLSLVDPIQQFSSLALAEGLAEEFGRIVLAAGKDAGVGEKPGVGLFQDGVANHRIDRRHAHQLEGNAVQCFGGQAGKELGRRLGSERDQQRRGLARTAQL